MIILNADDYAITHGVSRAIEQLAVARRLSATSAKVTLPDWPEAAKRIRELRDRIAIGLHLNLTVGAPAGPMPDAAPLGQFPSLKTLLLRSLTGRLSREDSTGSDQVAARLPTSVMNSRLLTALVYCTGNITCS